MVNSIFILDSLAQKRRKRKFGRIFWIWEYLRLGVNAHLEPSLKTKALKKLMRHGITFLIE
jgi:hypothetical protein